jgi:DNA gyrase subunit B
MVDQLAKPDEDSTYGNKCMTNSAAAPADNGEYSEEDIEVLKGLEAVRKRPGMYIGTTGPQGLHHLVYEIVDNSVDEALAGHCKNILVTINEDNSITVEDDGRGIPTGIVEDTGKSAVETVFTILHSGGKFGGGGYKVSGGLHGVGASVVNALSSILEVEVHRNGMLHRQVYRRGVPDTDLQVLGPTEKRGTIVRFWPDNEIFHDVNEDRDYIVEWDPLSARLREMAFLNKGLRIVFTDCREESTERPGEKASETYYYEGGIASYVDYLNNTKSPISDHKTPIYFEQTVDRFPEQDKDRPEEERDRVVVECALQWTEVYAESAYSFVNNINTADGGTHLTGFRMALLAAINTYVKDNRTELKMKETEGNFTRDDVVEGLTAIVSVKVSDPQFEGQTKGKLGNREVQVCVGQVVRAAMSEFLDGHPKTARAIVNKIQQAKAAREAAHKAKALVRRQSALENSSLPGKLADCTERDASRCEVYLVEGDSAGGSAKQGRNRMFQAILPLRGKILNVERVQPGRIYENTEVQAMIQALGLSVKENKDEEEEGSSKSAGLLRPNATNLDLSKLRYHKVIIMTDADVDGSHIRTLLLTFFFRYARQLVENGNIYIAQPPLFKVSRGKKVEYCFNESKLQAVLLEWGESSKVDIQRFKGLGEMMAEELWETTMDPDRRTLKQVNISDASEADHIFDLLMGEAVGPRREFIEKNADRVGILDI